MDTEKTSTDYVNDINEHIKIAKSINKLSMVMKIIIFINFMLYLYSFIIGDLLLFKTMLIIVLIMANAFIDGIGSEVYGSIYDLYSEMKAENFFFDKKLEEKLLITKRELEEIADEKERDRIDFSIAMRGPSGLKNELDENSESILKYNSVLTLDALNRYSNLNKERIERLNKKYTVDIGVLFVSIVFLVIMLAINYLNNYGTTSVSKLILYMSISFFFQRLIITRYSIRTMSRRSKNFIIVEGYLAENK